MKAPGRNVYRQRARGAPATGRQPVQLLNELLENFRYNALFNSAPRQVQTSFCMVRRFLWHEQIIEANQITTISIRHYLAGLARRGNAPKTILNHRTALSVFCRFLKECGIFDQNPCANIKIRRSEKQLPRYLEEDEVREVLRLAADHEIWSEVCLALSTGLRLSELIRLRWSDVDIAGRCLTVRKSKSRRPRVIPLCKTAITALEEQKAKLAAEAWRTQTSHPGQLVLRSEAPLRRVVFDYVFPVRQTWRGGWRYLDRPRASTWWLRALRPIKEIIPKFNALPGKSTGRSWHLFRHTFASRLAQRGVSLYKIAQWLGHSDVRTTQIYAHLRPGFDEEIEKLGIGDSCSA